jgi:hypothetical protein
MDSYKPTNVLKPIIWTPDQDLHIQPLEKPKKVCKICRAPVERKTSSTPTATHTACLKAKQEKNSQLSKTTTKSGLNTGTGLIRGQPKCKSTKPKKKEKKRKERNCKTCLKPLHALRVGKLCFSCNKAALKAKQTAKKERQERTIKGRKALKKKAEILLHLYIRKRAVNEQGLVECYTCRKLYPFEKVQAGHFRHGKLDLDERNLKPQCGFYCNHSMSGNLALYARRLVNEYGLEWFNKLCSDADRDTGIHSYEELKEKITYYQEKLKTL